MFGNLNLWYFENLTLSKGKTRCKDSDIKVSIVISVIEAFKGTKQI